MGQGPVRTPAPTDAKTLQGPMPSSARWKRGLPGGGNGRGGGGVDAALSASHPHDKRKVTFRPRLYRSHSDSNYGKAAALLCL